jgi:Ca2+-binding RTX toxin-like protein
MNTPSAGRDTLMGNASANLIDGLGGDDSINGGLGNDTLHGGLGMDSDTLVLRMTMAEWLNSDYQPQIAAATVTGANDPVVVTAADLFGSTTEVFNNVQHPVNGDIRFSDADLADAVTASAVFVSNSLGAAALGAFNLGAVNRTNSADGVLPWEYTFNGLGEQYLGYNETVTETYAVTFTVNGAQTIKEFVASIAGPGNPYSGGRASDLILGTSNPDYLYGSGGDDTLIGGQKADTLSGGSGSDVLWGGPGVDVFYGGTGDDTFVIDGYPYDAFEEIMDFNAGVSGSPRDSIALVASAFPDALFDKHGFLQADDLLVATDWLTTAIPYNGQHFVLEQVAGENFAALYYIPNVDIINNHVLNVAFLGRAVLLDLDDPVNNNRVLDSHDFKRERVVVENQSYTFSDADFYRDQPGLFDLEVAPPAITQGVLLFDNTPLTLDPQTQRQLILGTDLAEGRLSFVPATNATGTASFDYKVGTQSTNTMTLQIADYGVQMAEQLQYAITADSSDQHLFIDDGDGAEKVVLSGFTDLLSLNIARVQNNLEFTATDYTNVVEFLHLSILDQYGAGRINTLEFDTTALYYRGYEINPLSHVIQALNGDDNSDDIVAGSGTDDDLGGYGGNDLLFGNGGHDLLDGGAGNDLISGGLGNDTLLGEGGDDLLEGGAGDNSLAGGTGDDTYLIGSGVQTMMDDGGSDKLIVSGIAAMDALEFSQVGNDLVISGSNGTDGFRWILTDQFNSQPDFYFEGISFDGAHFDGFAFPITTYSLPNPGTVSPGAAILVGDTADNTLTGASFSDLVFGNDGSDSLSAGAGRDMLFGGSGDDTLLGGSGHDLLSGGAGKDQYLFDQYGPANSDTIADFESGGTDRIVFAYSATAFQALHFIGTDWDTNDFATIAGGAPTSPDQRIVFDPNTGNVFYDADGSGSSSGRQFVVHVDLLHVIGGAISVSDFNAVM